MRRLSRRQFCLVTGAGVVAGACGSGAGGADAGPRDLSMPSDLNVNPDLSDPSCPVGTLLHAGPAAAFAVDSATFFRCARLFVCRDAAGLFALSSSCTHEHCDVTFAQSQKQFDCPCHLSVFDFDGAVLKDPATQPLPHYAVSLDAGGNVIVDLSLNVPSTTRLGARD